MSSTYEWLINIFKSEYNIKIEQSIEEFPKGDLPVIIIESRDLDNKIVLNKIVIPNFNRLVEGWEKAFDLAFNLIRKIC